MSDDKQDDDRSASLGRRVPPPVAAKGVTENEIIKRDADPTLDATVRDGDALPSGLVMLPTDDPGLADTPSAVFDATLGAAAVPPPFGPYGPSSTTDAPMPFAVMPADRGNAPPPLPVIEQPHVPVHHHRVGGNARQRVHIEGHAGETSVVRVGRTNPGVGIPKITIPGDVLEGIALALAENDSQRALALLAPHYLPSEGIADAPRENTLESYDGESPHPIVPQLEYGTDPSTKGFVDHPDPVREVVPTEESLAQSARAQEARARLHVGPSSPPQPSPVVKKV